MGKWPLRRRRISRDDQRLCVCGLALTAFGVFLGALRFRPDWIVAAFLVVGLLGFVWGIAGRVDACRVLDAQWAALQRLDDPTLSQLNDRAAGISRAIGRHVGAIEQGGWDRFWAQRRTACADDPRELAEAARSHLADVVRDLRARRTP